MPGAPPITQRRERNPSKEEEAERHAAAPGAILKGRGVEGRECFVGGVHGGEAGRTLTSSHTPHRSCRTHARGRGDRLSYLSIIDPSIILRPLDGARRGRSGFDESYILLHDDKERKSSSSDRSFHKLFVKFYVRQVRYKLLDKLFGKFNLRTFGTLLHAFLPSVYS